ncbi:Sec-independent protein translocase subunit TatA [Rheinheimera baltica]|uniref:Sec-independent protein translocase protein TatA n=1 Tax=Rheinheimera baltica TaxID=67576 RepID=A0ABT9I0U4_9GAMM|nr:Sec-independent protein translocase subunit TatA [Rheinheimera baltica]MDP5136803.1 Sec-independent protein translocase subunit TatA [Rheinheimera baltica]MDP5142243.1 Sec-independent protein translocase subunit TatA [Rheinheimera baltica]MDP5150851.1 Sec-independent protein translocase subunit TatA [Rheinheimera baltica]MDP5188614.1 Sec-independent protein translocase subunit TatA [Rheinheimera baltica]
MFGNISIWQLLIVLAIIVLLFGTKKLRGIGTDLGSAIKGFRSSIKDEPQEDDELPAAQLSEKAKADAEKTTANQSAAKDKV